MDTIKYKKIVKKHIKKDNFIHNYIMAFISGGIIGFISQLLYLLLKNIFLIKDINSKAYISLLIILLSSFLTAIGIFDNFISKYRSGLIIPTTGFAHSVTSSLIDVKKEGLIKGLGSYMFHLAGSVILYSIVVSFILVLVKVVFFA